MTSRSFRAFLIDRDAGGRVGGRLTTLTPEQLDPGEVYLAVRYSSINYKDALATTESGKIIRRFPCVGGIDMAGEVVESTDPRFKAGDPVIATSFDLGVSHHGGYAQYARVSAQWVVPLPAGLSLYESMALGTAGFTAALAITRMEANGLTPANGPVIVSGATGGVGSLVINMLAMLNYHVVAMTGKPDHEDRLKRLGAREILSRLSVDVGKGRPLESARWAGAVDNVGGDVLHWILASMKQAGTVASIGNAASIALRTTVFPFILRGVSLLGVDSGYMGFPTRAQVWSRLASDLKPSQLGSLTRTVSLRALPEAFGDFLHGRASGRTVVDLNA